VLQANSRNLKAQAGLAKTFFDLHQYTDAASAFGRAVELAPDDPTLRTNMGIALEKLGRAEEAKRAFAEAQRLRSSKPPKP
jgi:Flp pilus assembly protein TadD